MEMVKESRLDVHLSEILQYIFLCWVEGEWMTPMGPF